ncbi:M56 family metallopeptidase [Amnibacterium kyonggiense]|uniref:Peptidase M48-like protein n=1 Tax=Amnibacterium kyonggiense TaxID=595671 RepID=A0A4R7FLY4_9MICO|nr:M56 family metallopeptidase [Amnibacterium kyonggiense]TDS77398.1 peptidase M48-like protein [Amnibacterium kyonggiense]
MILAASLLAVLAVLLAWPVPLAVARSTWPDRAPGTALLLWQAIALAGVLSLLGSLLVAGLAPYGPHPIAALRVLTSDVGHGEIPPATSYASALALAAAVLLGVHLVLNLVATVIRTERQRARHRSLLLMLSAPMPEAPRTRLLDATAPIAYCLPGTARSLTVLSAGLLDLLTEQEVLGVVEHERAHLRQHHALVLVAFRAWRIALPWFPVARRAQHAVGLLTEMLADDQARRSVPDPVLARAIVVTSGGTGGEPVEDGPASDPVSVERRVRRLVSPAPIPAGVRIAVPVAALALVVVPPLLLALPAFAG